ncbi:MAG: biopolymer transporter ExbD [Deltaproteobacteria bacterium]|jgi:biopolymer transport protein ExbD|nr:biopolymer transporter ExbD [Deltaproteobacteria bacterium]
MSRRKKKRGPFAKEEGDTNPTSFNLTALMDILSNIIFFLMASFGAQTLELTSASKVTLPSSTSEMTLKMSISVAVGMEEMFVEDEPILKLNNGELTGLDSERFLPKLEETLKRIKAQRLAKNEKPKEEDEVVLFIADKRLRYAVIDRVMKTCARVGFTKFRYAVSKK